MLPFDQDIVAMGVRNSEIPLYTYIICQSVEAMHMQPSQYQNWQSLVKITNAYPSQHNVDG